MSRPVTSMERWAPVDATLANSRESRSAEALLLVVGQFSVISNPRFQPNGGETFCNVFATDVAKAMGAPLPHWVDSDGIPSKPGAPCHELGVNELATWLEERGVEYEWEKVDESEAVKYADVGHLCVALWVNPSGHHGHIAVHLPGAIYAQAGAVCRSHAPREMCFPSPLMHVLHYHHP